MLPAPTSPGSYEECARLASTVRQTRPTGPLDEYALRGQYQAVLDFAIGHADPAPVFDFWWAVEGHRTTVGRGFYLDLWDLYDRAGQGNGAFPEADRELLRCYVCQINAEFVQVLAPRDGVPTARAWQARIADLATELARTPGASRRSLYAVVNLYADLYPDAVAEQGRAELARQLLAADAARGCRDLPDSPLLRPAAALTGKSDDSARAAFVHILALLYGSLKHFGVVKLSDLVVGVIDRVGGDADPDRRRTRAENLTRLLKFWAATTPLFRDILQDKCEFEFHVPPASRPVELPSYHGTDNFICLVGDRKVGKTHFMFASEAASRLSRGIGPRVPELTVRHVSQDEQKIKDVRKWWAAGGNVQDDEIRATVDQSMYARTAVRGLCRFTFYDIPGEDLYQEAEDGPSPWLRNHFKKRKPCGLLMMFDPEKQDTNRYVNLVDLLEKFLVGVTADGDSKGAADVDQEPAQKPDLRYREMPIYFVMNKADKLLVGDAVPKQEFARFLQAGEPLRDGFHFATTRFETGLKTAADAADRFGNTAACCRNLAFLHVLLADVARLAPVVTACLKKGYTNLSFVYTTCLPDNDHGYGAVRELWADLTRFLGESTVASRKAYYQKEFADQIDTHFKFAADLVRDAAIAKNRVALSNDDLVELVRTRAAGQAADDFAALRRGASGGKTGSALIAALPPTSGYHEIARTLQAHETDKGELRKELDRAIPALFRELGIPAELAVSEIQQPGKGRYEPPKDPLLQPGPTGSTTTLQFLQGEGYKAARKEFEKLLVDAIRKFNAAAKNPTETVFTAGVIAGPLDQLAGTLWTADAVGRQEVSFDPRHGSLNTLCPYKDREATDAEYNAMDYTGGGQTLKTLGEVILHHTDDDKRRALLNLCKHFIPRYPQFAYPRRYDLDGFKAVVLNKLKVARIKLDDQLVELTVTLLAARHSLEAVKQNDDIVRRRLQARYLIEVFRLNEFNVTAFAKDPEKFRASLSGARVALEKAIRAVGSIKWTTDKKTLDEEFKKFNDEVAKVELRAHGLGADNLVDKGPAAVERLSVAAEVFAHVEFLVGGKPEILQKLDEYAVPNFSLPTIGGYNRGLHDYLRDRQTLLLQERAQYLHEADWLGKLEPAVAQFTRSALNPAWFEDGTNPGETTIQRVADEFKAGVKKLCGKDDLWRDE